MIGNRRATVSWTWNSESRASVNSSLSGEERRTPEVALDLSEYSILNVKKIGSRDKPFENDWI